MVPKLKSWSLRTPKQLYHKSPTTQLWGKICTMSSYKQYHIITCWKTCYTLHACIKIKWKVVVTTLVFILHGWSPWENTTFLEIVPNSCPVCCYTMHFIFLVSLATDKTDGLGIFFSVLISLPWPIDNFTFALGSDF